jgi:hypothetical protein
VTRPGVLLVLWAAGCGGPEHPTLDGSEATDCASGGWKQVSASSRYTCGVRCDGALHCWGIDMEDVDEGDGDGKSDHGQVREAPVEGEFLSVATEIYWASALTSEGEVVSWGRDGTESGVGFPS